ncbi:MAG TPA: oligosaccharide flippase family protein [bacterium]|nr:oligosaccharide flippase family protein [bacterium]HPR88690.1 oligosaccharide flippase family protein [bacterium]
MNADIKKFLRHSSNYAIGELLAFTASFVSFPVLTRALSKSDYGVMSVFSVTLWIFLAFSRAGLAESTVRFYRDYHGNDDADAKSTYYSTFFFGTVFFALLTSAIVLFFGNPILTLIFGHPLPGFNWILAGLILTGTLTARMLNFYRASQRTIGYNIAMVAGRFVSLAFSLIALLLISRQLLVYYRGILAAEVLTALVLVGLFVKQTPLSLRHFSMPFFKNCLSFGVPLIGFELGYLLLKSADRYILQFMLGSEAVAIFSVASNMGHYAKDLILFPLMYALTPIYIEIWHDKGREATSRFVSRVADLSLLILVPVFLVTAFLGQEVIVVLASEKYAAAGQMLGWMVAGTLLWALLPIYAAGLYVEKRTKLISLTVLVCVVIDVLLNIVLIHYFGIMGSCYAALASCAFLAIYLAYRSARYLRVRVELKSVIVAAAAGGVMYGAAELLPQSASFFGVVLKMALLCFVYGSMVMLLHGEARKTILAAAGNLKSLLGTTTVR